MLPFTFQYPATEFMQNLIVLHHDIFFFLIIILITVVWLLFCVIYQYRLRTITINSSEVVQNYFLRFYLKKPPLFQKEEQIKINKYLEFFWTCVPTVFISAMLIPSFTLLYWSDAEITPVFTLKVYGRQWFWTYEYKLDNMLSDDFYAKANLTTKLPSSLMYESYLIQQEDLLESQVRLLEVDKPLILPVNTSIRLLFTSFDVIHSWSVPSLGLKVDAIPGVINQAILSIKSEGIFYGQCYELCGPFHGFMPITVYVVNLEKFFFFIYFWHYFTEKESVLNNVSSSL